MESLGSFPFALADGDEIPNRANKMPRSGLEPLGVPDLETTDDTANQRVAEIDAHQRWMAICLGNAKPPA